MSSVPHKVLRNVKSSHSLGRSQKDDQQQVLNSRPQSQVSRKSHSQFEFSPEPYTYGKNFAIYAPTQKSIAKLYQSSSLKPSQFYTINSPSHNLKAQIPLLSQRGEKKRETEKSDLAVLHHQNPMLTQANLNTLKDGKNILLHKMKSYKSSSTVDVLNGLPLQKTEFEHEKKQEQMSPEKTQSFTKTISYREAPWVQIDTTKKFEDPYSHRNTIRIQAAFRASGQESVNEIIQKSKEIRSQLSRVLPKSNSKPKFSFRKEPTIPTLTVRGPVVRTVATGKGFLIAENSAHTRETNSGYFRKANGTFYNH